MTLIKISNRLICCIVLRQELRNVMLASAILDVVVARMLSGTGTEGFDAGRKQYVDLIEAGIIDPTKVVRIGLENAVSVASILLLTEATMTEIPEDKKDRAASEPEMAL